MAFSILGRSLRLVCGRGRRFLCTAVCPQTSLPRALPWLVIPPSFEGEHMMYNFYSLGEGRVLRFPKQRSCSEEQIPEDDAVNIGSTHGWLVSINQRKNNDVFLSNPLSGRHLKLPSIYTLPYDREKIDEPYYPIDNLILSSPDPDEESCIAIMTSTFSGAIAFCRPGAGDTRWTPLTPAAKHSGYSSLAYSSKKQVLYSADDSAVLDAWNFEDPCHPRKMKLLQDTPGHLYTWPRFSEVFFDKYKREYALSVINLVVDGHGDADHLFVVKQYVALGVGPDGEPLNTSERRCRNWSLPYQTLDFDVFKYDPKVGDTRFLDRSLGGLALFVGFGHPFALPAHDFPELKSDSIYFTDNFYYASVMPLLQKHGYGGHDNGIFNYVDRTISPCCKDLPCHVSGFRTVNPVPVWFTPNN